MRARHAGAAQRPPTPPHAAAVAQVHPAHPAILARHGATRSGSGSGAGGRVPRHGPGVLARNRRATRHATGAVPPVGVYGASGGRFGHSPRGRAPTSVTEPVKRAGRPSAGAGVWGQSPHFRHEAVRYQRRGGGGVRCARSERASPRHAGRARPAAGGSRPQASERAGFSPPLSESAAGIFANTQGNE